jgi:hypothetical protein
MLASGHLCAQNRFLNEPSSQNGFLSEPTFAVYTNYFSKEYGVTIKMPKQFTDLKRYIVVMKIGYWQADGYGAPAFLLGPQLKSKDKDCIIGYGEEPYYTRKWGAVDNEVIRSWRKRNDEQARSTINGEIKATLGIPQYLSEPPSKDTVKRIVNFLYDTTWIDLNKYVTIIAGKRAKEMFNADSIFLYDLPMEKLQAIKMNHNQNRPAHSKKNLPDLLGKPYEGKYTYCTRMFIYKRDRATLNFTFFLTPKGKKKEDEYINQLSKQIWYDDDEIFQAQ